MSPMPIARLLSLTALIVLPVLAIACGSAEPELDAPAGAEQAASSADTEALGDEAGAGAEADDPMAGMEGMPELVQIRLTEFGIESTHDRFETGVPYRFVLQSDGALEHDFQITPRGEAQTMVDMGMDAEPHSHGNELLVVLASELEPGAIYTTDLTFYQPGSFEFACHVAGHFQLGMWLPIEVTGEVLATPTPIDPDSIVFDPNMMSEAPCHVMGTIIMGQCTEEDIAAIKAELLGTAGEDEHADAEHGHEEDGGAMDEAGSMDMGDEHGEDTGHDDAGHDDTGHDEEGTGEDQGSGG